MGEFDFTIFFQKILKSVLFSTFCNWPIDNWQKLFSTASMSMKM